MVDNAYPFLFSFCCVFVCCLITIQIYNRFSKFQTFSGKIFLCLEILGKVRWGTCVRIIMWKISQKKFLERAKEKKNFVKENE